MSHAKGIAQAREVGAEGEERTCKALAHAPAGQGTRSLWVFGELVTQKIPSRRTGGAYTLFEVATRPGAGPPPHVNHREDESFYVLEGEYEFLVDERTVMAQAGSLIYVPKGCLPARPQWPRRGEGQDAGNPDAGGLVRALLRGARQGGGRR